MFKAKKLDKLVAAGIITQTQKVQILEYEDNSSVVLVHRALMLLGIFTIGLGIISLVASNWDYISRGVKLAVMFALLAGSGGLAWYWQKQGKFAAAEKMLLGEFFLTGAGVGLVIQTFHLSGGKIYEPLAVWCLLTLPLLFATGQKLVSAFWVPLFLIWGIIYICYYESDFVQCLEVPMAVLFIAFGCGRGMARLFPNFSVGSVLERRALDAFYLIFFVYILYGFFARFEVNWEIEGRASVILVLLSLLFKHLGEYALIGRNIKLGGLTVFCLYISLGNELGLFETGISLVISGAFLLLLLKYVPKVVCLVCEEKKNA